MRAEKCKNRWRNSKRQFFDPRWTRYLGVRQQAKTVGQDQLNGQPLVELLKSDYDQFSTSFTFHKETEQLVVEVIDHCRRKSDPADT